MKPILIVFSTTDGHTAKICHTMQETIARQGQHVSVKAINDPEIGTLEQYDKIIIGASVHYGRHRPEVLEFIQQHLTYLQQHPSGFFSVNLTARKADKRQPANNPYLQKFLRTCPWQPRHIAVFAGKLDYPRYRPLDRLAIQFIMWLTHGPTNRHTIQEFTDWQAVAAFASDFAKQ